MLYGGRWAKPNGCEATLSPYNKANHQDHHVCEKLDRICHDCHKQFSTKQMYQYHISHGVCQKNIVVSSSELRHHTDLVNIKPLTPK